ncbi:MAG TPA: hypothetical protein VHB97_09655 [Polyangia bacterium]|nr:hypothetical protein [Polyangia bacterium]
MALLVAGCNFAVNGVELGSAVDTSDLAMTTDVDLAASDDEDLATPPPPPVADLAMPPPPDLTPATGMLTGAIALTPGATPIDLTTEGLADWTHWGTTVATSFDHKNAVTMQISNFTNVANTPVQQLGSYGVGFTWADGTPTPAATNSTTGVYTYGAGAAFRITARADTTTRTLRLYAGGQQSTATVTAHLSDASAADYTTTTTLGAGDTGNQFERTVTLVYHAAAAGQTLTVTWALSSNAGYVHVHSATLQ